MDDFTFFSTVFQSYDNNGRLCAVELQFLAQKMKPQSELKPGTAKSVGQCLTL